MCTNSFTFVSNEVHLQTSHRKVENHFKPLSEAIAGLHLTSLPGDAVVRNSDGELPGSDSTEEVAGKV